MMVTGKCRGRPGARHPQGPDARCDISAATSGCWPRLWSWHFNPHLSESRTGRSAATRTDRQNWRCGSSGTYPPPWGPAPAALGRVAPTAQRRDAIHVGSPYRPGCGVVGRQVLGFIARPRVERAAWTRAPRLTLDLFLGDALPLRSQAALGGGGPGQWVPGTSRATT
jgi:hypothetical protein